MQRCPFGIALKSSVLSVCPELSPWVLLLFITTYIRMSCFNCPSLFSSVTRHTVQPVRLIRSLERTGALHLSSSAEEMMNEKHHQDD